MKRLLSVVLTTALLIIFFAVYTYLDRARLYENIGTIIILANLAAYLLPGLVLPKSGSKGNSFARVLIEILIPSLISIPIFVGLICIFNILNVPDFLSNIPLYQFIFFTSLMQLAYAVMAALVAAIVLKIFIRHDSQPPKGITEEKS